MGPKFNGSVLIRAGKGEIETQRRRQVKTKVEIEVMLPEVSKHQDPQEVDEAGKKPPLEPLGDEAPGPQNWERRPPHRVRPPSGW